MISFESLTEKQKLAVQYIKQGKNVFVTSKAGCGKSYLLQYLKKELGDNVAFCAPTGVSAINIRGITLHSFFKLGNMSLPLEKILEGCQKSIFVKNNILKLETLIIDEISMVSSSVLEYIEYLCRTIKEDKRIFGGVQIVVIGDFLQLPPILDPYKNDKLCFKSHIWKTLKLETVLLTEVKRQKNLAFIELLDSIRKGNYNEKLLDFIEKRNINHFTEKYVLDKNPVAIVTHNSTADHLNNTALKELSGKIETYNALYRGDSKYLEYYKENSIVKEILHLKKGSLVMLIRNLDVAGGLANGSLGRVVGFENRHPVVTFNNGRTLRIEPFVFKYEKFSLKKKDSGVIFEIEQIPLILAYALTVHKLQGVTLDAAILDVRDAFVCGHVYTAMSRVKSPESLFITSFDKNKLKMVDKEIVEFYDSLEKSLHLNENNTAKL